MTPATSRPRKTIDDLMSLPDGVRAELIEGEIYVTPSPSPRHQFALQGLSRLLQDWAVMHPGARVLTAPCDVELPTGDVVQPDLFLVAAEKVGRDRVRGVPDLVVEVVSASHPERDRLVKRDLYAHSGVPEYWIVDPDDGAIEVLRLASGRYGAAGYFRRGSVLASPTCAGLRVDVTLALRFAYA
jgi:Uma2 family endonuclease